MSRGAFQPYAWPGSYDISATTNSVSTLVNAAAGSAIDTGINRAMVTNEGPNTAYVTFGDVSAAASLPSGSTAGSLCVVSGATVCLTVGGASYAAAITRAGTARVNVTPGDGFIF